DVTIQWNDAFLNLNGFIIPERANNAEATKSLATWMRDPDRQAEFVEKTGYGPVNEDVFELLSDEILKRVPNSPDHREDIIPFDEHWRGDNQTEILEHYSRWLAG